MPGDLQRTERLNTAAAFAMFDKKLSSSGNSSMVWGSLNLLLGGLAISAGNIWGAVSLILGLGLVGSGLYEKKVRDPKVVIVSAATLAALAAWNFALIALAATGKMHLVLGGRTLFWGIAQAVGAFSTWKTYAVYKALREKADESTVQEVRGYVDELAKTKAAQSLDLVEFEASAGFGQATKRYRLKPIQDLYVIARYKSELGTSKLEEIAFVPRNEVTISPEGEKFMSKKIKASVRLGALTVSKVTITPEMAERIDPAFRAMSLGTT